MFGLGSSKWTWIIGLLLVANILYYFFSSWGLVTVKVTDAPLGKIIHSIEWQGWVAIYTNLPLNMKVTMYVDHAPLAEAMETLAANVDVPPPGIDGAGGARSDRNRFASNGDSPAGLAGGTSGGGFLGRTGGGTDGAGTPGGTQGRRGVGLGGPAAQWNLAFFVAPTAAQVRREIHEFETDALDDDAKVYTYVTPMQLVASDSLTTASDPRLQSWPGVKPVDPSAPSPADPQANAAGAPPGDGAADPPANSSPTMQTYLEALAASANIWIMAPGSWAPGVASPPPLDSSIIRALKNLVGRSHGAVTEALVLRAGRGGRGGNRGDFAGDDAWADRMRNAISGLPPDQRPAALEQLNHEIQFRKEVRALPPEQRRQKMLQHFMEKMLYGERLSRLSPAKRAQVYQRMVAARAAGRGQK